jgi:hypothetical protein
MRNVSDKSCRENQNAHFVFCIPPPPENRAVYEIMLQPTYFWMCCLLLLLTYAGHVAFTCPNSCNRYNN